jgi:hypothetical protein
MLRELRQPWDPSQPSILDYVRAHMPDGDRPGLLPGGDTLPDDEPAGGVRFAPGMLDGVNTRHFAEGEANRTVDALLAALRACRHDRRPGRARQRLYKLAASEAAIEGADRAPGTRRRRPQEA